MNAIWKRFFAGSGLAALLVTTAGCTGQQLAQNLEGKSISGSGFFAVSKICVSDPSAGDVTPMLKTVIVNGEVQTILKDANFLHYDRKTSAAWYNASNTTTLETLTISLPPGISMADVLKASPFPAGVTSEKTENGTKTTTE